MELQLCRGPEPLLGLQTDAPLKRAVMPFGGWRAHMAGPDETSQTLAGQWRPYVEACIEAFGVRRCMFESNFPVDRFGATYTALWNAFKRLAAGYSADEKTALFSGAAKKAYRLEVA